MPELIERKSRHSVEKPTQSFFPRPDSRFEVDISKNDPFDEAL
jgi:hypothetical protein